MAYIKAPYNNTVDSPDFRGKPPRGVNMRGPDGRPVTIIESKAVNERRRKEREAAGLTNDFKLLESPEVFQDYMIGDPRYYKEMLGDTSGLSWAEEL